MLLFHKLNTKTYYIALKCISFYGHWSLKCVKFIHSNMGQNINSYRELQFANNICSSLNVMPNICQKAPQKMCTSIQQVYTKIEVSVLFIFAPAKSVSQFKKIFMVLIFYCLLSVFAFFHCSISWFKTSQACNSTSQLSFAKKIGCCGLSYMCVWQNFTFFHLE